MGTLSSCSSGTLKGNDAPSPWRLVTPRRNLCFFSPQYSTKCYWKLIETLDYPPDEQKPQFRVRDGIRRGCPDTTTTTWSSSSSLSTLH
ncbi:hypothetical protein PDJAM_G00227540 [Pangasius djambal]|uniref:Uncharacterized protein n=1 Tax=Pangasius djambal TaxID=1691987 RepID=A0ACC5YDI5_9TELE|nr:hypothetical protein [Pangasius djambal]